MAISFHVNSVFFCLRSNRNVERTKPLKLCHYPRIQIRRHKYTFLCMLALGNTLGLQELEFPFSLVQCNPQFLKICPVNSLISWVADVLFPYKLVQSLSNWVNCQYLTANMTRNCKTRIPEIVFSIFH